MIRAIEALPGKKTWPKLSSRKSCKPRKNLSCNFYRLLLNLLIKKWKLNILVSFLDMMVYAGDSVYNQFERHPWLDALCDMWGHLLPGFCFVFLGRRSLENQKVNRGKRIPPIPLSVSLQRQTNRAWSAVWTFIWEKREEDIPSKPLSISLPRHADLRVDSWFSVHMMVY